MATVLAEALERERPFLLAVARMLLPRASDDEDLVQQTLERAVRNADQLRDIGALRAWLLRIETREALRLRRQVRALLSLDASVLEIAAPGADPDDRLLVRGALARLSPRVRAAVVLHHMVGLSVPEVAELLGSSPNTVKSQLRTGLARLRLVLRDD